MKINLYAVFDVKAEAYGTPMAFQNDALASRAVGMAAMDSDSMLCNSPGDFNLHCLGEYDNNTGVINAPATPRFVNSILSVKHTLVEHEASDHEHKDS